MVSTLFLWKFLQFSFLTKSIFAFILKILFLKFFSLFEHEKLRVSSLLRKKSIKNNYTKKLISIVVSSMNKKLSIILIDSHPHLSLKLSEKYEKVC